MRMRISLTDIRHAYAYAYQVACVCVSLFEPRLRARMQALNEDKLSCRAFPSCVFIRGLIYSASIRQVHMLMLGSVRAAVWSLNKMSLYENPRPKILGAPFSLPIIEEAHTHTHATSYAY